jgi:hypothetical protein
MLYVEQHMFIACISLSHVSAIGISIHATLIYNAISICYDCEHITEALPTMGRFGYIGACFQSWSTICSVFPRHGFK